MLRERALKTIIKTYPLFNMHIVYDFDGTLFATGKLWDAWSTALQKFDVSEKTIHDAALPLFDSGFTTRAHAEALGISGKKLEKLVDSFARTTRENGTKLVFPEVLEIMEEFEGRQSILTYGDEAFQTEKVTISGIADFVDDVFVASPDKMKPAFLREMIEAGSEPITFIDDKPEELMRVHDAGLPVRLLRMIRDGERHAEPHACDDDIWECITSLEELLATA